MTLFRLFLLVLWSTTLETFYLRNISTPSSETDYMKALHQTIHAIDKLVSFFEEEIYEVNLDGISGLRQLEGALAVGLAEHCDSFWNAKLTTKYIHQKLIQLDLQAGSISNRAQASLKEQEEEYYFTFKELVDRPWSYFKGFGERKLPLSRVKAVDMGEAYVDVGFQANNSDRCLSEALGSNANHKECMFTPICVKWITNQKTPGYGPTHQILFLTFAIMHNCEAKYSKILEEHLGIDVDGLIENRCVKIMDEMLGLEKKNVPVKERDLYIEQGWVCSIQGYEEFLSLKRLENILSWQRTPGCYGNKKHHKGKNGDDDKKKGTSGGEEEDNEEQKGKPGFTMKDNVEQRSTVEVKAKDDDEQWGKDKIHEREQVRRHIGSFRSMRRLLNDVVVAHNCSAHESAVAAALLGVYTKWLLTKVDTGFEAPIKSSNLCEENTRKVSNSKPIPTNRPVPANKDNNR